MLLALVALALAVPARAPDTSPDTSLDGVYGQFPVGLGGAVQFEGARVNLDLERGSVREGRLRVDPDRHMLTVTDGEQTHAFTYGVHGGELVLGVLVRHGDRWISRLGGPPDGACTAETLCLDWDGQGDIEAFGTGTRLVADQATQDTVVMAWSQSVGPVGRVPAADQAGLAGRWWGEGAPGTRVGGDGTLHGWGNDTWGWSGDGVLRGPIRITTYHTHGPMGHGNGDGRLLWFLATDGRLFVHHRRSCCGGRGPSWADLERVESPPEVGEAPDGP